MRVFQVRAHVLSRALLNRLIYPVVLQPQPLRDKTKQVGPSGPTCFVTQSLAVEHTREHIAELSGLVVIY